LRRLAPPLSHTVRLVGTGPKARNWLELVGGEMSEAVVQDQGKTRALALRGFYLHLLGYVLINAFLLAVNVLTSRGNWWFQWPLIVWGIGVAAHGACISFGWRFWPKRWEKR